MTMNRCPKCDATAGPDDACAGISPAEWQRECEDALFVLTAILERSGRRWASSAAVEILRSVPRSATEDVVDPGSLLYRCYMDMKERGSIGTGIADRLC